MTIEKRCKRLCKSWGHHQFANVPDASMRRTRRCAYLADAGIVYNFGHRVQKPAHESEKEQRGNRIVGP